MSFLNNITSSTTSIYQVSMICLASLALGGCQTSSWVRDDIEQINNATTPQYWSGKQGQRVSKAQPGNSTNTASVHGWVAKLNDPVLSRLVEEAIQNNPDLKIAASRMENARQLMRLARSELFPSLNLNASGTWRETNGAYFDAIKEDEYLLSLGTSWELDLWGEIRHSSKSGEAAFEAAGFDLMQARHSLVASVCSTWYDCIAAYEQLTLAAESVESYERTADLVRNRFENGIDSALEVRLAVANAENAKSGYIRRKEAYKRSLRGLQVLLGRYPNGEIQPGKSIPSFNLSAPADVPSSLLERRPDIRAAEKSLLAAGFALKSASKSKLPTIMITGSTGTRTEDFRNMMDGNFDFWSTGISLSQPLFTGGRIDANEKRTEAAYDQAKAYYEQIVLRAFSEVEQALDAEVLFADLERSSISAAEQSGEAETLAWDQYTAGLINIVTVLESQRFALSSRQSVIEAKNARIQNRIKLYLALGGDA